MNLFKTLASMISFGFDGWHNATATFTGECMDLGHEDKDVNLILKLETADPSKGVSSLVYQVTYEAYGREIKAWYHFPNGEDPDPKELAEKTMEIRFLEKDPHLFEKV